jgi:hypothetical protein
VHEPRRTYGVTVAVSRCDVSLALQSATQLDEDLEGRPREENEGDPEQATMESKKRILSALQHLERDRFPRLGAQPSHVSVRIMGYDDALFEASLPVFGHMNERQMEIERVLSGGEDSLTQQLPDYFLHKKRVAPLVAARSLADFVLDGVKMGLRRSPQSVEHKWAKKCLVHG